VWPEIRANVGDGGCNGDSIIPCLITDAMISGAARPCAIQPRWSH
jgi:hypothetical protein